MAGVLQVQYPVIMNTKVPSDFALGGVLVVLGLADAGGEFSDGLVALGSGMLAVGAARETAKAMQR